MERNELTLKIDGKVIPLEQFASAVAAFSDLIHSVSRAIPDGEQLKWRTEVKAGSAQVNAIPMGTGSATGEIEQAATQAISHGVAVIEEEEGIPEYFREHDLESIRKIARLAVQDGDEITHITLGHDDQFSSLGSHIIDAVSALIGQPKTVDYGSIEGKLQMVSTRGGYRCSLYERVRDARVSCDFPQAMLGDVLGAIDQRVLVYGRIEYSLDGSPEHVRAESIEQFPAQDTLPSAEYVRGILREDWAPPGER